MQLVYWLSIFSFALANRGIPLYFVSFEKVGDSRIEPKPLSVDQVDEQITSWLDGCHSDGFILIRDSAPFDSSKFETINHISKQSLTRGSFLSDYMLNLKELAEDIQRHCSAQWLHADYEALVPVPAVQDSNPRVIYLEFDHNDDVDKEKIIRSAVQAIPSPYVTVVYTSTYAMDSPILPHVELNPKRLKWQGFRKNKMHAVVAPLYTRPQSDVPVPEPPSVDIPDHVLLTVVTASSVFVVFLLFKNVLM